MLTFQISDTGATLYHALEDRDLTVGSGEDADLRLRSRGVAAMHARIEPVADQSGSFRLLDLGAGTRVNGAAVREATLAIGDRIEIGEAVLVLGRRLQRPATARDVLARGVSTGAESRRRSRAAAGRRSNWWAAILIVAGIGATIGYLALSRDGVPPAMGRLRALRDGGRFDEAQTVLDGPLREWAAGNASREAWLVDERSDLDAVRRAFSQWRERLVREALTVSYGAQIDALKEMEGRDAVGPRIAARLLRSQLKALRREAVAATQQPSAVAGAGEDAEGGEPAGPAGASPSASAPDVPVVAAPGSQPEERLADVDRAVESGRFAQALEMLRETMAAADVARAQQLRERLAELRATIRGEMQRLVGRARRMAEDGLVDEAIGFLRGHAPRFPHRGDLSLLARALEELEAGRGDASRVDDDPGAADRRRRRQETLTVLADVLDEVRQAETRGDLTAAARLSRDAASRVQATDPLYARRLVGQADDHGHVAAMAAAIGRHLAGKSVRIALRDGTVTELRAVRDGQPIVATGGQDTPIGWEELAVDGLADLFAELGLDDAHRLGLAVLAYRADAAALAERELALLWNAEPSWRTPISGTVRRGRRAFDDTGFELVDGRFLPSRLARMRERAVGLRPGLTRALRAGGDRVEKFLERELASGPDAIDALVLALVEEHDAAVARLAATPFDAQWAELAATRAKLDAARSAALELIFDEARYFYPYLAPAVPSEKAITYFPVQAEVERRVAAVRELWDDPSSTVAIPAALRTAVERWRRLVALLERFGEVPRVPAELAWIEGLPAGGEVGLRSFCRSAADRERHALSVAIEAHNQVVVADWSPDERRVLALINDYRRMLGVVPFAANAQLHRAARGHAAEMDALGFLGHYSTTPGRRTPFDRMRAEGYEHGASENCALDHTPGGAFTAWCGSSGHHRNLLDAAHLEAAVGGAGNHWVLNLGAGRAYLDHAAFSGGR